MNRPAVPDTFHWIEESWGLALKCRRLDVPHLFTTRQLALSSHDDWHRVARSMRARRVQTLAQVHGSDVFVVRSPEGLRHNPDAVGRPFRAADDRPRADILVSNDPAVAIAVRAADCAPMLIADHATGAVAAVHAGWRGTAASAASAAVAAMRREFGSRPADLIAAIGPSIGPCCYEVGTDVVDTFAAAGHARHLIDRWFPSPRRAAHAAVRPAIRLDLWTANRDQLIVAGLLQQNVHVCGLCTASHVELFPSYRVEKENAGRIAGVICARAGESRG